MKNSLIYLWVALMISSCAPEKADEKKVSVEKHSKGLYSLSVDYAKELRDRESIFGLWESVQFGQQSADRYMQMRVLFRAKRVILTTKCVNGEKEYFATVATDATLNEDGDLDIFEAVDFTNYEDGVDCYAGINVGTHSNREVYDGVIYMALTTLRKVGN